MDTLKEEYEEILSKRKEIIEEISELSNNDIVKRYFKLCQKNNMLAEQEIDLYEQIKSDEYACCNHIWVRLLRDYDEYEGRTEIYCGCMKCGLDERVLCKMEYSANYNSLTNEEKIMYDFMQNNHYTKGMHSKVFCDFDLAKAIYSKIKEKHPNISDELAKKYFEIALDNIRNIKVSDERKENRAKRLSLSPKLKKWN